MHQTILIVQVYYTVILITVECWLLKVAHLLMLG